MLERHRLVLSAWLLLSGLLAPAMLGPDAMAVDERDCRCQEYEDEVLVDARGDVNVEWPGTVDLYYAAVGEIWTRQFGENYLFVKVGLNITKDGEETVENDLDGAIPRPPEPLPPRDRVLPGSNPVISVRIQFRTDDAMDTLDEEEAPEGRFTILMQSFDMGESWVSPQSRLIVYHPDRNGHGELVFLSSLRRFDLEFGERTYEWSGDAFRDGERTDTMRGAEFADEAVPGNQPTPTTGHGTPMGMPQPDDLIDHARGLDPARRDTWVPDGIEPGETLRDPEGGNARSADHHVQDGRERILVRIRNETAYGNVTTIGTGDFTVTNTFDTLPQRVTMYVIIRDAEGWSFRYGPDSPGGVKTIAPGETDTFSLQGVPRLPEARRVVFITAVFLSDYGAIQFATIQFVNTDTRAFDDSVIERREPEAPMRLVVTFVNENDPFRLNEPRLLMFQVQDEVGRSVVLEEARVFIWPLGERRPETPYVLKPKFWMPGVYENDYTFHRPGAWNVEVVFYDFPPSATGGYPSIMYHVRVDYNDTGPDVLPLPLALGGVGLGMAGLVVRERLQKNR